jgi:hypothetical protein
VIAAVSHDHNHITYEATVIMQAMRHTIEGPKWGITARMEQPKIADPKARTMQFGRIRSNDMRTITSTEKVSQQAQT